MMQQSVLERIDSPQDLKRLEQVELYRLAFEIRELIIKTTSVTGGHLASSLGAVEIAIATLRALDCPRDRVVWDVGHQAYAYKILTGRRDSFNTMRQHGGVSGFPRRSESEYDVVDSGHSGSSISHCLGLAIARDIKEEDFSIAAVIGDGSMTSGVAYEAMNQAGHQLNSNLIIILNDNEMSISQNVGGISSYLSRLRIKPGYKQFKHELEEALGTLPGIGATIVRMAAQVKDSLTHALVPGILFEAMGLKYVGPIDGHDIALIEETISGAKEIDKPVLIHTITQKGRGYDFSERRPEKFHGTPPFDSATGKTNGSKAGRTYTSLFGEAVMELARGRPELVAITAAMKLGTGLDTFSREYPGRFFDVGIAEQLGVNLAAGMALGGLRPVVAIYSTFLQRAYDQLSQEVCLQDLPVVLVVDRAGLVGEDGRTHHGYFDVSYLRTLPNMTVMAPGDARELKAMLEFALDLGHPVAVRFPRGLAPFSEGVGNHEIELGRGEIVRSGKDVALLALGDMVPRALATAEMLTMDGIEATVANARFAKPIDPFFLREVAGDRDLVVTMEDNVGAGGFGSAVAEAAEGAGLDIRVHRLALPDSYVEHGTIDELMEELGLSPEAMAADVRFVLGRQR